MSVYYNEIDPFCCAWLKELMKAGEIPDGEVDSRSIELVQPDDLGGFTQCHFFAGIGGWAYALRLAGWGERPVWTGSCPCQPWSQAGRGDGEDDARHLWPVWFRLIGECAPAVVFGEQVASADGHVWLARVHRDLETASYSFGAADLCAAGVGAPHKRQRYFFVAHAEGQRGQRLPAEERQLVVDGAGVSETPLALADASRERRQQDAISASGDEGAHGWRASGNHVVASAGEAFGGLADAHGGVCHWWTGPQQVGWNTIEGEVARGGRQYRAQWRVKPGLSLLAYGIPGRMEQCRGYGNAIVPQVAQVFIEAYLDAEAELGGGAAKDGR